MSQDPITIISNYLQGKHNIPDSKLPDVSEIIMHYAIQENIPLSDSNIEYMFEDLFLK